MRKLTRLLPAMLALTVCLASCLKVEEKDYSYSKALQSDADSLRAKEIMKIIRTNPYFDNVSTYFGTYTDTYVKAQEEFVTEVNTLNDSLILEQLNASEYAALLLISDTSGETIAYKTWNKGKDQ